MAVDLATLNAELETDPLGLGYATFVAAGNATHMAALVNDRSLGAGVVVVDSVTTTDMQRAVVATEYLTLAAPQRDLWLAILSASDSVPVADSLIRAQILAVWLAGTDTRSNLGALQTRPASRGELLFGAGVTVTALDCSMAIS